MGLIALYEHEEILKRSSSRKKYWSDFEIISQECLGDPFQNFFVKV